MPIPMTISAENTFTEWMDIDQRNQGSSFEREIILSSLSGDFEGSVSVQFKNADGDIRTIKKYLHTYILEDGRDTIIDYIEWARINGGQIRAGIQTGDYTAGSIEIFSL